MAKRIIHNLGRTKEWRAWRSMRLRCYYPRHNRYELYKAKGIIVCDRWRDNFLNFLEDMGYAPTPKHSIGRIDNNGNYEPTNCRWETNAEQQRNTSRSVFVETIFGRMLLMDVAKLKNVNTKVLYAKYSKHGQRAIDRLFI